MFASICNFNPRPTCVGRRDREALQYFGSLTSIHAPHAWGDKPTLVPASDKRTSIHAPHAWGDPAQPPVVPQASALQSTPHMRGATGPSLMSMGKCGLQSTPHMRGATFLYKLAVKAILLQSTPHMRGATAGCLHGLSPGFDFNPRPTCVGRPKWVHLFWFVF